MFPLSVIVPAMFILPGLAVTAPSWRDREGEAVTASLGISAAITLSVISLDYVITHAAGARFSIPWMMAGIVIATALLFLLNLRLVRK